MKRLVFICFCLWTMTLLISCQEEEDINLPSSHPLKAFAGEDQEVEVNRQIILDGAASQDGNYKPRAYVWTVLSKPEGSQVVLENAHKAQASFTPDQAGEYTFKLKVYNIIGNEHADKVTIRVKPSGQK
ncbi:PKD domain-containing protein [Catalinimonas niigatensis]|uniref:PKD domain-containing protein n=1 Tax=Catalinimonas niigatensis TaxID=1397264 RepID=UPI0026658AEE|nr:hypothetical protein [Catalinimonas niigatensis]WPP48674.1 hypothetical protein PZB72_18550 [Catalinimonas niigatensis]